MKKTYRAERVVGTSSANIPASLSREVGRIIVKWAHFENSIQEMIWQALQMDAGMGRLVLREPRAVDRLELLGQVLRLRNADADYGLLKVVRKTAETISRTRDLLAHGIWFHHPGTGEWLIQSTKGNWNKEHEALVSGSKKITPESIVLSDAILRETTLAIDRLLVDLKTFRASARA